MKAKRLCIFLFLLLLCTNLIFAGGNLTLESCSINDGDVLESTDVKIDLVFSNNVVNIAVKEKNQNSFELKDSKGNAVPFTVLMGDDQEDSSIKRNISIEANGLEKGEQYTLTIKASLEAKNGSIFGNDQSIGFSIKGEENMQKPITTTSRNNGTIYIVLGVVVVAAVAVVLVKKNKKK